MIRRRSAPALVAALTLGAASPATAQEGRWSLLGFQEIAVDHYDVTGDLSASPYPFEGTFTTGRLSLGVEYRGDYRSFRLVATGRASDDASLAEESALETLALSLQDGSHRLPFRLHAGDVFAGLSRRTLSAQIKGASLELQPQLARGAHSLLLLSGTGNPGWEEALEDPERVFYGGVSYAVASRSGAHSLVATLVDVGRQPPAPEAGGARPPDDDHRLASLAAESAFGPVRFEGEVARLSRDEDGAPGGDGANDDEETSFYAQLGSAGGGRFAWKLRWEDNGSEYVTPGAVGVIADRRAGELDARYRFGAAGTLRLRAQSIDREVEGPGPMTEIEAGSLSYRGRLVRGRPSLALTLSADVQEITADDGSEDRLFQSHRLRLEDRLGAVEAAYEAAYRASDDALDDDADRESVEHELTLARVFVRRRGDDGPLRLRLGGGLAWREQRDAGAFQSWSPVADFSLVGRHHRLGLHLSFLEQDFALMTVDDLAYVTQRLTWTWERGRNRLALDVGHELRDPETAESTRSLRARLSWRVRFAGEE